MILVSTALLMLPFAVVLALAVSVNPIAMWVALILLCAPKIGSSS